MITSGISAPRTSFQGRAHSPAHSKVVAVNQFSAAQEGRLNASKTLSFAEQPFWVSVQGVSNMVMNKGVFLLGKALHHVK